MNGKITLPEKLRSELSALFECLHQVKQELAAIHLKEGEDPHFETMSQQLDAIVAATEQATDTILQSAEAIAESLGSLQALEQPEIEEPAAAIEAEIGNIFEACSFQDITGQRVNKVVRSLNYVDDRVNNMVRIVGQSAVCQAAPDAPTLDRVDDDIALSGPALSEEGATQDEIDRLFD